MKKALSQNHRQILLQTVFIAAAAITLTVYPEQTRADEAADVVTATGAPTPLGVAPTQTPPPAQPEPPKGLYAPRPNVVSMAPIPDPAPSAPTTSTARASASFLPVAPAASEHEVSASRSNVVMMAPIPDKPSALDVAATPRKTMRSRAPELAMAGEEEQQDARAPRFKAIKRMPRPTRAAQPAEREAPRATDAAPAPRIVLEERTMEPRAIEQRVAAARDGKVATHTKAESRLLEIGGLREQTKAEVRDKPIAVSSREQRCLATAVYFEARGESEKGQKAVAEVVLARTQVPGRPKTICGVVYEGSNRSTGCQFSFTCDAYSNVPRAGSAWTRAQAIARATIRGRGKKVARGATFYHAHYVSPGWASRMVRLVQIGSHIFYRPKHGRLL